MKKIFLSILLLTIGVTVIVANSSVGKSDNDQMIIQFESLVEYNKKNTKEGNEHLNKYIFLYTPGQEYNPALPPTYEFLFEYPGGTTPDAELINQTLLKYNNNSVDGEFNADGVKIKDYNYQHYVIVINLTYAVQSKLKNNNSSEIQHPSWYKSFSEDETVRDLEHYKDKKDNLVNHFKTKFSFDVFAPDHEYLISFFTVSHDHSLKTFGTNTNGSQFLTSKKTELTIFGASTNSTDFKNKWLKFRVFNENVIKSVDPTGGSLSIIKSTVSNYINEFYNEKGIDGKPCDNLRDQILYSDPRSFFEDNCTPEINSNPDKINALFTASLYLEYLYYQYDIHFSENAQELDYPAVKSFVDAVLTDYFNSGSTDNFALYIRFNFSTILPDYNGFDDKTYGLKFNFLNMYYNPQQPTVAELKRKIHASQLIIEHYHSKLNAWYSAAPPVELINGVLDYMYGISDLEFPSFIMESQWANLSNYFEQASSGAYTDTELVELLTSVKTTANIQERLFTKWLLGDGGGNFWKITDQDTGALNLSNFIVKANIANSAVGAYKSWAIPYNYDDNYAIGPSNKVLISDYTPVSTSSDNFFNYEINICEQFGIKTQLVQINPTSEFSDWKTIEIDNCNSYHTTQYNNVNFFDKVDLVTLRNHTCYENYCYDGSYNENYHTSKPVAGFFLAYTGNREKLEKLYDDLIVAAQIVGALFTFGELAAATGTMKIVWGLFSLSNITQFYTINNYQQFEDDLKLWFADEDEAIYWAGLLKDINVGLLLAEAGVGVSQMAGLTGTLNLDHIKRAAALSKATDDASGIIDAAILEKYAILKKHGHTITGIYAARNNGNISDIISLYREKIIGINNIEVLNTPVAGLRIRQVVLNSRLGGANYPDIHVTLNTLDNTSNKLAAFGNALKNDESLVFFFSGPNKFDIDFKLKAFEVVDGAGVPVLKTEMENIAGFMKNTGKSVVQILDDIPLAGGYSSWYGRVLLEKTTRANLLELNISNPDISEIFTRIWHVDDVMGDNLMATAFNKICNTTQSKSLIFPEQILKFGNNLDNGWFGKPLLSYSNGSPIVVSKKVKDFLFELDTGVFNKSNSEVWFNEVAVSYKVTGSGSTVYEMDNIYRLNGTLVGVGEAKRVSGYNFAATYDRLKDIVKKFIEPGKLPPGYSGDDIINYGFIKIDEPANPFFNLNEDELKNILINGNDQYPSIVGPYSIGSIPAEDLAKIDILRIINNDGEFKILANEW
ncbi:MAG: hypothetical protein ACJATI_003862 [Halioglobus sp.]|jgi:hypothetical protein